MDFINMQLKLVPDLVEAMYGRYKILQHISLMQPIGRRSLSQAIGLSERILRSEVDFLKEQGLVMVDNAGMRLSNDGNILLQEVYPYIKDIFGLSNLENKLKKILHLKHVHIVMGDSDVDENVKKEMGKVAAKFLREFVKKKDVVALTGGSSVAEVANMIAEAPELSTVKFVPARGGIGQNHDYLANTIVSKIAKKTGGSYLLLHVPGSTDEETYKTLMNEEQIKETLQIIRNANILIHGIGDAITMAKRRMVPEKMINHLKEKKAIGEAFAHYFAEDGEIIYKMSTIGISFEDLYKIPNVIAVAGGKSKANAILAVLKHDFRQTLVTDEGAAREMIKKLSSS